MRGEVRTGTVPPFESTTGGQAPRICIREFPPLWIYRAGQAPPKRSADTASASTCFQASANPNHEAASCVRLWADGCPQHF